MTVLAASLLPLLVGVLLTTSGGQDAWLRFGTLLMAHSIAGWASWTCHYQAWGQRVLWMLAVALHTLTYTIFWDIYAVEQDLLQNLVILGIIVIPSGLMYAGPFNAVLRR